MVCLPPLTVARPRSLSEALAALATEPRTRILAGGTDLLVALKQGHGGVSDGPVRLLSLAGLALSGVAQSDGHWQLGATSSLWDLARWTPPADHRPLLVIAHAAREIAAPPIRSHATLGGNLCLDTRCFFYNQSSFWRSGRPICLKAGGTVCHVAPGADRCWACHQADLAPVMIALGASATIESVRGKKEMAVESLYSGAGKAPLALAPSELLTRVALPVPPMGSGAGWEKIRMRRGLDFALASAAVYLEAGEDGTCRKARVVLGALGTGPIRVPDAEQALRGTKLEPDAVEMAAECARTAARPVKNVDLTPAYRKKIAGVAVTRAARRAWDMAVGGRD